MQHLPVAAQKTMNLFIDTNVLLTFYHLTGEDIEELKKLSALIDNKKITFLMPQQVREEFQRNRDVKIKDALKRLSSASFNVEFPAFCKHYDAYSELRTLLKQANAKHAELSKKVVEDAKEKKLNADPLIQTLFGKAADIPTTPDLFNAAITRMRVGNPPGKKDGSIGDEICWEALLSHVAAGQDLHVVSGDGDYAAPLDENSLHPFLIDEWKAKKKGEMHFYTKISHFFKKHFPEIKIASEVEKSLAITALTNSGSFAATHIAISKLSSFSEFSAVEADQLISLALGNNQVGNIITDNDVKSFYTKLIAAHADDVDPQKIEAIKAMLEQ